MFEFSRQACPRFEIPFAKLNWNGRFYSTPINCLALPDFVPDNKIADSDWLAQNVEVAWIWVWLWFDIWCAKHNRNTRFSETGLFYVLFVSIARQFARQKIRHFWLACSKRWGCAILREMRILSKQRKTQWFFFQIIKYIICSAQKENEWKTKRKLPWTNKPWRARKISRQPSTRAKIKNLNKLQIWWSKGMNLWSLKYAMIFYRYRNTSGLTNIIKVHVYPMDLALECCTDSYESYLLQWKMSKWY